MMGTEIKELRCRKTEEMKKRAWRSRSSGY
jgi:hypothetical protein